MKRPPVSLKAQALALLARREYSRAELRSRLLAHARKLADLAAQADSGGGDEPVDFMAAFMTGAASPCAEAPPLRESELREQAAEAAAAEVDAVLDWLAAQRHQSDSRFVESRVHARAGQLGQSRIRQELARHGVTLDADTAQQLRDSELSRAREVWRRRFGQPPADASERARQMRFLAARGFAADAIRRVVGGRDDD